MFLAGLLSASASPRENYFTFFPFTSPSLAFKQRRERRQACQNSFNQFTKSRFSGYRLFTSLPPQGADNLPLSKSASSYHGVAQYESSLKTASVRLVDPHQRTITVVPMQEAIQLAADSGLDLVVVSSKVDPPLVKIGDVKRFAYRKLKRKKDGRNANTAIRAVKKVLKLRYNIDDHDYSMRLKTIKKFLEDGYKVKIIVELVGREKSLQSYALELIERIRSDVGELAKVERLVDEESIFVVLAPDKAFAKHDGASDPVSKEKVKVVSC